MGAHTVWGSTRNRFAPGEELHVPGTCGGAGPTLSEAFTNPRWPERQKSLLLEELVKRGPVAGGRWHTQGRLGYAPAHRELAHMHGTARGEMRVESTLHMHAKVRIRGGMKRGRQWV